MRKGALQMKSAVEPAFFIIVKFISDRFLKTTLCRKMKKVQGKYYAITGVKLSSALLYFKLKVIPL